MAIPTPDPAKEPMSRLESWKAARSTVKGRTLLKPFDESTSGRAPADQQPDAFARLEAWLAEDSRRHVAIDNSRDGPRVRLRCVGAEVTAKEPGLAATIDAALEQAKEVEL